MPAGDDKGRDEDRDGNDHEGERAIAVTVPTDDHKSRGQHVDARGHDGQGGRVRGDNQQHGRDGDARSRDCH